MKCLTIGTLDEKTGLFCIRALHGYPPEHAAKLKEIAYTMERMKCDLNDKVRVTRKCYLVRTEDRSTFYDDDFAYMSNPQRASQPRQNPDDWSEMDYIDFIMSDRLGNWIGYLEINEPGDGKMPSMETLDRIQILSDLAAIAIENSKMYEEALYAMSDSQAYLDLIVHDIGNMITPLKYYLDSMKSSGTIDERNAELLTKADGVASSAKLLVDNVRKFSEARSVERRASERYDLEKVLNECANSLKQQSPQRNITVNRAFHQTPAMVIADELIYDLFMNLLSNAVKYDLKPMVEIDVKVADGNSAWIVTIEDRGRGIPDDRKNKVFRRFAMRPEGYQGTGLGLSIVSLLVERYNGFITVRDRVGGDYTQGTCFEIALPKAEAPRTKERALEGVRIIPGKSRI